MADTYRLQPDAGMHRLGRERDDNGHPVFIQPGEVVTAGEDVPGRVIERFSDKFEEVQMRDGRVVSADDSGVSYTEDQVRDMTKAVLRHVAHEELGLTEDDIGTEHSESGTPVKEDYVDAILPHL